MDNSSCLPLVSPFAVVVSENRQRLSSEGVTASVNEESVVPTDGCGNSSSHDSSIQPNVAADVNITLGHATSEQLTLSSSSNVAQDSMLGDMLVPSEPHIGATHGEAGPEVLTEFDTKMHVARRDEVGEWTMNCRN
ncbi:hypothetical protein V6N12_036047 [Hibiscus sabdariffa]|uniref:Uncharacterized protein n=1 Tax=Hibiscus sabdariffa TaxID=183260 RepID=A0ABR2ES03_9ROSI